MSMIDSLLRQYIVDEVSEHLPRIVADQLKNSAPLPEWLTEAQLAEYWQLRNPKGELTTAGIRSWSDRPADEHPLPYANMGEIRRYKRTEADRWAREEVEWQRARVTRRRVRLVGDK